MKSVTRDVPADAAALGAFTDTLVEAMPTWVERERVRFGLTEALTNALVHGALEIDSAERDADYLRYLELIEERSAARRDSHAIRVVIEASDRSVTFKVRWTGAACPAPYRSRRHEQSEISVHGRGLGIIYSCFDDVDWDDDGFGMTLVVERAA
jgi:anti-sigma regulatory factor (Ser/Thr protein kinase)